MSRVPITLLLSSMNRRERILWDHLGLCAIVRSIPLGYTDKEIAAFARCHYDTVRKVRTPVRRWIEEEQRKKERAIVERLEEEHRAFLLSAVEEQVREQLAA